jgi:hypothetical protein
MFLNLQTMGRLFQTEEILPKQGPLREELVSYVDDYPFTEFVADRISSELSLRDKYQSGARDKLIDIEGYGDVDALANRLISEFESLPWQFHIHVPLPALLSDLLPEDSPGMALSSTVAIARATPAFCRHFPLESKDEALNKQMSGNSLGLLFIPQAPKWTENALYLQIQVKGYVNRYGTSNTALDAERLVRSVIGLGAAVFLIDYKYQYQPASPPVAAFVHRKQVGDTWYPHGRFNLSDSVSTTINRLILHTVFGSLKEEHKKTWYNDRLLDISFALRAGKSADPTLLAAQWLFDSLSNEDELLGFVRSMVVMEILLGDQAISNETGIGELISSRFAYLVGKTHEERTRYIEDFRKIYRVRSQIVHRGKPRLTTEERYLFHRLQWMCRRTISKEIELHKAAVLVANSEGKKGS